MEVMIKDVAGHSGYKVTSEGVVIGKKGKPLKPLNVHGYMRVDMYCDKKHYREFIHRLVAKAFLPNPHNYPIINHKDENPRNNDARNLEWCTYAYNNAYGTKGLRTSLAQINRKDCSKQVAQYDKDGKLIAVYESLKEAQRKTHICRSQIARVCEHRPMYYTAGGYKWGWA